MISIESMLTYIQKKWYFGSVQKMCPMRIAINTRFLIMNKLEGIGWFTYETLSRIVRSHPEHHFYFIFDRKPDPKFIFSTNVTPVILYPQARHPILWYLWFEFSVRRFLKRIKPDLFISTDGFLPLHSSIPSIGVIHDINFHHYAEGLPLLTRKYYNHFFTQFAHKASRIVTVSEYSKNDIAKSFNVSEDKIDVVYNGVNTKFKPVDEEEKVKVREVYSNGNPYFVFVGALNPRKNVARLLQAFDLFLEMSGMNYSLVIVGEKMFMTKDITNAYKSMKNKDTVSFTGRLQVDELRRVVGAATAMTFVPYFEGFGIPMLEAMNCDVPLIASDRTSMPEVAGDAAYYVDPFSVESIAQAMKLIAIDEKLRDGLVAKAQKRKLLFSWDITAEKFYDSINHVLTEIKKNA
jgi:glycosyltransferase involved in cell wall biosynthesis